MDTFYLAASSSPPSQDHLALSDDLQHAPMLSNSPRSSITRDSSSLLTPSSPSLNAVDAVSRAMGPPKQLFTHQDAIQPTSETHASLTSQILNFKRQAKSNQTTIERLEFDLSSEVAEKEALQEEVKVNTRDLRAARRQLQTVEEATIIALEQLCRARDEAIDNAGIFKSRLEETWEKLRETQEANKIIHDAWGKGQRSWDNEGRALEMKATIAENRLQEVLRRNADLEERQTRQEEAQAQAGNTWQDDRSEISETFESCLTTPVPVTESPTNTRVGNNWPSYESWPLPIHNVSTLAAELEENSDSDTTTTGGDAFDLTPQQMRYRQAREVRFSSLASSATNTPRHSLRIVEAGSPSKPGSEVTSPIEPSGDNVVNNPLDSLMAAAEWDVESVATETAATASISLTRDAPAIVMKDAGCQTSPSLTEDLAERRTGPIDAQVEHSQLPPPVVDPDAETRTFNRSSSRLAHRSTAQDLRAQAALSDNAQQQEDDDLEGPAQEEQATADATDRDARTAIIQNHWTRLRQTLANTGQYSQAADDEDDDIADDGVFHANPRTRWAQNRPWRTRFVPVVETTAEDEVPSRTLAPARSLSTVIEERASFERPMTSFKSHSFTVGTVRPHFSRESFAGSPSIVNRQDNPSPPFVVPPRLSSMKSSHSDREDEPKTPTRQRGRDFAAKQPRRTPNRTQSLTTATTPPHMPPLPQLDLSQRQTFLTRHTRESSYSSTLAAAQNHALRATTTTITTPATDRASMQPSIVKSISATVVGEWMWKCAKSRNSFGSRERQKRWVWLDWREHAVLWSSKQPVTDAEMIGGSGRKLPILSVLDVKDTALSSTSDPSLPNCSIMILTPSRALKLTATTLERHYLWLAALSFMASHAPGALQNLNLPSSTSHKSPFQPTTQPALRRLSTNSIEDNNDEQTRPPLRPSTSRTTSSQTKTKTKLPWHLLRRRSNSSEQAQRPSRPSTSNNPDLDTRTTRTSYHDGHLADAEASDSDDPAAPVIRDNRSLSLTATSSRRPSASARRLSLLSGSGVNSRDGCRPSNLSLTPLRSKGQGRPGVGSRANSMPAYINNNADLEAMLAARTHTISSHYNLNDEEHGHDAYGLILNSEGEEHAALPPLVPRLPTSSSHLGIADSGPVPKKGRFTWGSGGAKSQSFKNKSKTLQSQSQTQTQREREPQLLNPVQALNSEPQSLNPPHVPAVRTSSNSNSRPSTSKNTRAGPAAGAGTGAGAGFMTFRFNRKPSAVGIVGGSVGTRPMTGGSSVSVSASVGGAGDGGKRTWSLTRRPQPLTTSNTALAETHEVLQRVLSDQSEAHLTNTISPTMPARPPPPPPVIPVLGGNVEYASSTFSPASTLSLHPLPPPQFGPPPPPTSAPPFPPVEGDWMLRGQMQTLGEKSAFPPRTSSLPFPISPLGMSPMTPPPPALPFSPPPTLPVPAAHPARGPSSWTSAETAAPAARPNRLSMENAASPPSPVRFSMESRGTNSISLRAFVDDDDDDAAGANGEAGTDGDIEDGDEDEDEGYHIRTSELDNNRNSHSHHSPPSHHSHLSHQNNPYHSPGAGGAEYLHDHDDFNLDNRHDHGHGHDHGHDHYNLQHDDDESDDAAPPAISRSRTPRRYS